MPETPERADIPLLSSLLLASRARRGLGPVYREAAFRQLLAIERRRAARSRWLFVLVLVSLRQQRGRQAQMSPAIAASIFDALSGSTREVDFIGWYKEGRVIGTVLVQGPESPADSSGRIVGRITRALENRIPAGVRPDLKVRVAPLRRTPWVDA